MPTVHLIDYVAGNVRSLANAIEKLGHDIKWIRDPSEIEHAGVSCCNRPQASDSFIIGCSVIFTDIDITWSRPLRSLFDTMFERRVPGTSPGTHLSRQTLHGHLCWITGPL